MAKIEVSQQLAVVIKTIRQSNHITAKHLAESIGKSPSYISKLEKGGIKTLQEEELRNIFRILFPEEIDPNDSTGEILDVILKTYDLLYENDDIEDELWFYNFDTVKRFIPIPEQLIDDINQRIAQISLERSILCQRINRNEEVEEELKNNPDFDDGNWHTVRNHDKSEISTFILLHITDSELNDILEKKVKKSNYVTILAIDYFLRKIEKGLDSGFDADTRRESSDYLNKFKFYSKLELWKLVQKAKTKKEYEKILSTFDLKNEKIMSQIINTFLAYSDYDVEEANKKLEAFAKNLIWDKGFMMSLLSTPFFEFQDVSYIYKKQMFDDIQRIIDKYKEEQGSSSKIEAY